MVEVIRTKNAADLARPTWDEFTRLFYPRWEQGEHVFIYGETGSGKTDLAFHLLNKRKYSVSFITKPRDPIFKSPLTKGWQHIESWPPRHSRTTYQYLLSAKTGKTMADERANQIALFPEALDRIYRDGGWTVHFDESMQFATSLGMKQEMSDYFYLGRSFKLTGIACSQRPRYIPVIVPQSCKWAFISRTRREDDLRTLAELGYSRRELEARLGEMRSLHDFLFIDPQGDMPLMVINTHS